MAHPLDRPLTLGVALDGAGGGFTAADHVRAVRLAEDAGLDFAALGDSLTGVSRPDALLTLAAVAPHTRRIGLVPTVTVTHTEPFHVSKAVASLDFASRGRAGWWVEVSRTGSDARAVGRRPAAPGEELWAEATAVADVVSRLWDSWEDGAEIRDTATGRFVDRDRLHYVDFEGPGWSVRGPSITPRPPQGRPPVVVRAEDDHALATAAVAADVVVVTSGTLGAVRERYLRVREEVAAAGRDQDGVAVLAEVRAHLARGPGPDRAGAGLVHTGSPGALAEALLEWGRVVDGFVVGFGSTDEDLPLFTERTVPLLRESGVLREGDGPRTLRDRLGLARPDSRYGAG